MRTWGRVTDSDGNKTWQVVETDEDGNNDMVRVTQLIQDLKLNLNESPFYANYGIPAQNSVITQIFPDFYVTKTQQQFAQYFTNLTIAKVQSTTPTYRVNIILNSGVKIDTTVSIPQ